MNANRHTRESLRNQVFVAITFSALRYDNNSKASLCVLEVKGVQGMKFTSIPSIRDYVRYQKAMREPLIPKREALQISQAPQSHSESLRAKLKSGQELTPDELEYLRNHDPDLYGKAVKAAQERKAYESSMRQSRTKSELNTLHNQTLARILKVYKHGDPEEAMMQVSAIQDAHRKFMQSDEYAALDTAPNDKA